MTKVIKVINIAKVTKVAKAANMAKGAKGAKNSVSGNLAPLALTPSANRSAGTPGGESAEWTGRGSGQDQDRLRFQTASVIGPF